MNIQDLNFIKTCDVCPEQYDIRLDDGTLVGYVRFRWGTVECYPADIRTGEIKWNKHLIHTEADYVSHPDDILIECGTQICAYQNELAFLEMILDESNEED